MLGRARLLRRLLAAWVIAASPAATFAMPLLAASHAQAAPEHGGHRHGGPTDGRHSGAPDCCNACVAACTACPHSPPAAAAAPRAAAAAAAPLTIASPPIAAPRLAHRLPFPLGPPALHG
jgi:hypothetical protein